MHKQAITVSSNLISAVALVVIELICFLPIMGKVGFYLDDWATMAYLHFAPHNQGFQKFLEYYLLNDSRVQNRPLEVLHFGLIHWFAGTNPWPFHLCNLCLEVLSSYLAYRIFVRISGAKAISIVAAFFFLLHPGHDSTHYWVICSSVTLSMFLYLCSLHFSLAFVDITQRAGSRHLRLFRTVALSAFFFLLSLLNYETLIPLAAINVLLVSFLTKQSRAAENWLVPMRNGFVVAASLSISIAVLFCYLKFLMPIFGKGYVHQAAFDWSLLLKTIKRGCELNLPVAFSAFALEQCQSVWASVTRAEWLRIVASGAVSGGIVFWLRKFDRSERLLSLNQDPASPSLSSVWLAVIGAFGVIVSYSIFGLNSDYEPTYYTIINRINAGASFASAILLLGLLKLALNWLDKCAEIIATVLLSLLAVLLVTFFTLTNFAMARPWLASWQTQTVIRTNILAQKSVLGRAPTLLLLNCPRYVMWSPVFDGVWDFSNMLRIGLNDFNVNANVISERLTLDDKSIIDVSRGFKCGQYPFSKLFLFVAPDGPLVRALDGKSFVRTVEEKGMGFGLAPDAIVKWKKSTNSKL